MTEPTRQERSDSRARGVLRSLGRPLLTPLDQRLAELRRELEERTAAIEARLPEPGEVTRLHQLLVETHAELVREREALRDLAGAVERFARTFTERADDVAAAFAQLVEHAERARSDAPATE